MTFEEDLTKRRIDVAAFATGDPERFAQWQQMYAQMHPNSFYVSVKMVLNDIRRRFWLAEAVKPATAISAEAPAKPVTRRAAIPGAPKPAAPTPPVAPNEQPESKPAAPVKGRAVIRKPAVSSPEANNAPETAPAVTPEVPPETPPASPSPRPRPVIRKPAPAATSEESPVNQAQIIQDHTNHAAPFHTNPDPETAAPVPKPPRPRPVIKRPVTSSETNKGHAAMVPPPEIKPENEKPEAVPVPAPATEPVKATPPRPRPVMRRPNPPAEENVPPVSAIAADKAVGEEPGGDPAPSSKPLRPRPIFKRPQKPEGNSEQETENSNQ